MEKKKELVVPAIENGTVIDHIPTESVYQVIHILGLENYKDEVLIGNYLQSGKLGRKGIIKNFVKCANPKCITNVEAVPTQFDVVDKENLKLRCHYCEKFTTKETIHFNLR